MDGKLSLSLVRGRKFSENFGFCTSGESLRNSWSASASGSSRQPAQFETSPVPTIWISIPAFILSEANLGILGLGVAWNHCHGAAC